MPPPPLKGVSQQKTPAVESLLFCLLALKAGAIIWKEASNKLSGKGEGEEREAFAANQPVWSFRQTHVWHSDTQQSLTGAQRCPIQKWWLIFIHQKRQRCRGQRERERPRWEDGGVWEKCGEDRGGGVGGGVHLAFSKCKRNTVLSHTSIITPQPTYSVVPSVHSNVIYFEKQLKINLIKNVTHSLPSFLPTSEHG